MKLLRMIFGWLREASARRRRRPTQAAERLGVTQARVRQVVRAGRLPAEKVGRDLFISESDLKLVENRKPGRPPSKKQGRQP